MNREKLEDENLIYRCVHGDSKAQRLLYEKYSRKMYHVSLRYLSDSDAVKDVLSETFVRVFNKISNFKSDGEGSFERWIKTITINESLRFLQKKKRMIYKEELEIYQIETDDDIEGNIDIKYLLTLVKAMPNGYRIVFNLYVIENYSHSEISEMLSISVSTSKSQLFKARNYLMAQLKKQKEYEMG